MAMLWLLDQLREDRSIARRRKIARAVEWHLIAGFSQAETAELLGESRGMVQQRVAFFLAWARLAVAPDLELVERAVMAAAADPRLSRGPVLAEAARRFYLQGEPKPRIAAALGLPRARVEQDLRLFAAWVASRQAKGASGAAASDASAAAASDASGAAASDASGAAASDASAAAAPDASAAAAPDASGAANPDPSGAAASATTAAAMPAACAAEDET
jgi:hypothetical protein